ncbi:mechanosensitive ion channel family protein [Hymenobacter canadensis]|uniref:Mechanosensitive ion channel n=1 Tax=Hymenobacter canadensis TaxID=2999067 RepID=A0ABY7LX98_9BACT|nr:mechanosensitive ion channel domain-containing protein [Hymenobacter canadensis]WBA44146.1 mechanosensitive ion channel [Hymenobacter canadensis]
MLLLFLAGLLPFYGSAQPASRPPVQALAADTGVLDPSTEVEAAYLTLGRLNASSRRVADTEDVEQQLPVIEANLQTIYHNLTQYGNALNARQLLTFQILLKDMRHDLTTWRTTLTGSGRQLADMQQQLNQMGERLSRVAIAPATPGQAVLSQTLGSIRRKQARTSARVQQQHLGVSALQNRVSGNYVHLLELEDNVAVALRQLGQRSRQPDAEPLPRASATDAGEQAKISQLVSQLYADQRQLLTYYFHQHGGGWGWMLAIGGLFFGWVYRNFRRADQVAPETALDQQALTHLRPWPVAGTLVVVLTLAPFFDLQAPAGYIDLLQFLLLATLTFHLARSWPRPLYGRWLLFTGLFFGLSYAYAVPLPGPGLRWLTLALHLAAAALGAVWARRLRPGPELAWFVGPVLWLSVALHLAAATANGVGYLGVAKLISGAAIYGVLQIIALSTFIRLITQALHLQMQRSRLASGASARFNFDLIERQLHTLLSGVVLVLWLVVFLTNLNLFSTLYGVVHYLLTTPFQVGSATFSLLNLVLSGGIVFLTFQVQQYVGYFFGEADDEFQSNQERKGSKMLVIRLVVFATGFLLAVLVSGLPLDKIALVFGALSVGIGLGLQGIVNNLVSGVILIFERPFQVGDYIEVAGKTGRVKDIGIRSSKLISMAGSEIIMPNGDLLAGHVINWTLSNNHMRVELDLKLAPNTDLERARQLISEEVLSNRSALQQLPPEILLRGINGQVYDLKVLFWINNIRQEQLIKSEILASIHKRLTEEGILLN